MRWQKARRSSNVEDRRGSRFSTGKTVGGGAALLILLVSLFLGIDPTDIIETNPASPQAPYPADGNAEENPLTDFVSAVLGDTEDTWRNLFAEEGSRYIEPTLVLYDGQTGTACGFGSAATGPFYCPGDQTIYLDLSFFRDLGRLGAPGDFAGAYVIAHEVGHHVQRITGIEEEVRRMQQQSDREGANALSVRMELQADCFAGIWAHYAETQRDLLETGDVEEGVGAAAAVGDDRLQRSAGRVVQPETFTHGSSEQRVAWFRRGLESGRLGSCDTFSSGGP